MTDLDLDDQLFAAACTDAPLEELNSELLEHMANKEKGDQMDLKGSALTSQDQCAMNIKKEVVKDNNTTGRTFAYCRVSTTEQTTANQIQAIRARGYDIQDNRVIEEVISGSKPAMERPEFKNLVINKLEQGDRLIVLKLDRLGRDNIDVQKTVSELISRGIDVTCLDLPVTDLSSPEGKMMLQMFMAFAEFERNRIVERTKEGLARAKSENKTLGRPTNSKRMQEQTATIQACKSEGLSQSMTAKRLGIGIATVKRHWNL